MLSSFELNFDLSEEMNAITYENTELKKDTPIKIYIPTLMSGIPRGSKPEQYNLQTDGKGVFKNKTKKPVLTTNILKEQNYMKAKYNTETTSNDLDTVTNVLTDYLETHIDPDVHSISQKGFKYTIKKGSPIRVQFLNGKISKLSYYITSMTNAVKRLV